MNLTLEKPGTYLGPAKIGVAAGRRVRLDFPDQQVWALLALATHYEPVAGDRVLAISQDENWYVIGVLEGKGLTRLTAPGDLEICAPRGKISLTSAESVSIQSPEVKLTANKLELFAKSVFQRFSDVTMWVKKTFDIRADRIQTRVESTFDLKAKRIVQRAEEDVKIDGQKIRLG